MIVWRALDGIPDGNQTTTVPQYQPIQKFAPAAPGAALGWICVQGGQPGQWENITTPLAVGGTTTSTTTLEEGAPQNGEIAAMRKELALLRAAVKDLQLDHQRPIN